jgi:hypothetical protein
MLICVGFLSRFIRIRRPKVHRSRFRRRSDHGSARGSSVLLKKSDFQSTRRDVTSTHVWRLRLLSSCAPKRATAKPALLATTFRVRFSPNTPISRNARSSSQSLNASVSLLQTWKPPGTSAGFLRRSTPSWKTGTRPASRVSQPWGGRIGGQSSD